MFDSPRAALLAGALALTLVHTATPAYAADVSWFPVHDLQETTRVGGYPELASSADGMKVAAVWIGGGDGGDQNVQVATSGDGGRTWGAAQILASDPQGSLMPEIVSSADASRLTVMWSAKEADSDLVVRSRTSTDGGATWGDPVEVSSQNQIAYNARLVARPDAEHLVATWSDQGDGSIVSSRSVDGAGTWSAPLEVLAASPPMSVDLVASEDGTRVMQFVGGVGGLKAMVSEDGGQSWGVSVQIASGIPVFAGDADMSADGRYAAVVWREFNRGRLRIFRAVTTDGGMTWSAPVEVSGPDDDSDHAVLVMSSDGQSVTIVWPVPNGQTAGIYATTSSDAGEQWGPVRQLGAGAGAPRMARILGGADGVHLTVTWNEVVESTHRIVSSASADSGSTWGEPTTVAEGFEFENSDLSGSADGTRMTASWWGARDNHTKEVAQVAGGMVPLPEFSVQPAALDFGTVRTGASANKSVTVTNTGTADLTINSVSATGPGFAVDANDCSLVAPGASCAVSVGFAPSVAGAAAGSLDFSATTGAHTVALSGTGEVAPTGRKTQKPRDAKGMPPKRIKLDGTTELTGRDARTTGDQRILTRVSGGPTAQGEMRYFRVIRGREGKVSIRTYGRENLKVVLVQYARGTDAYKPYRKRTVYVGGVKR